MTLGQDYLYCISSTGSNIDPLHMQYAEVQHQDHVSNQKTDVCAATVYLNKMSNATEWDTSRTSINLQKITI